MASKKSIRDSLMLQLRLRGADIPALVDMVDQYMTLWQIAATLRDDIDTRGVVYKDFSSVGVEMWKNNPSVSELNRITTQMAKLLQQLKISTDSVMSDDDDDEL